MKFQLKETTLNILKPGDKGKIKSFNDIDLSAKLQELGCVPGEWISVEKIAPLGDPMMIKIENSFISLRKKEAEEIVISIKED